MRKPVLIFCVLIIIVTYFLWPEPYKNERTANLVNVVAAAIIGINDNVHIFSASNKIPYSILSEKSGVIIPSKFVDSNGNIMDAWGNPLHIEYGLHKFGSCSFGVWSDGEPRKSVPIKSW